ncbi:MAG: hypothetical protein HKP23_06190 [Flavobacteriaceae bacterium]|nr:hypothetical protein [Eudoraea sp.]NNJ38815.1 hypothetical protein [Flavobacteriaceae bacterium]
MRPTYKALLYNFIAFAIFFLTTRLILGYFWPGNLIFLAVGSAVVASILAPKFGVIKTNSGEKLMMKWVFIKKVRQL